MGDGFCWAAEARAAARSRNASPDHRPIRNACTANLPAAGSPGFNRTIAPGTEVWHLRPRRILPAAGTLPRNLLANRDVLVGAVRFELTTLCSQSRCATRLRYAPTSSILSHSRDRVRPRMRRARVQCPARKCSRCTESQPNSIIGSTSSAVNSRHSTPKKIQLRRLAPCGSARLSVSSA